MKITLEFDTEKDKKINLHKLYIKAEDMSLALWDIKNELRSIRKYSQLKDNQYEIVEEISDKIFEILSNYELNNIIQ